MQLLSPSEAAGRVTAALRSAAEATGAGFDYLLRTARRESSLNAAAQAPTSSARGLFQFIDQTWLEVLKEEGPKLGLADAAADVSKTASGRYAVSDPARRAELLALRDDPQAAAMLAGAFTRRNAAAFTAAIGRPPSEGELYAAHFLGAQGAVQLTSLAAASPQASAADAFPAQAASNRAIFFDKGRARSALEVYAKLTASPADVSAPSIRATAVATSRTAAVDPEPAPYNGGVEDDRAAFHSMFKTGRRSPVSAYVQQAWSAFGAAGLAADIVSKAKPATVAAAYAPAASPAASPAAAALEAAARKPATAKRRVAVAVAQPGPQAPNSAKPAAVAAQAQPPVASPAAMKPEPRAPLDLASFLKIDLKAATPAAVVRRGARP
ncbi:lytic transglycosylase domain-containing protein [Hansschlegelia zhihuaiae]|uniref:lytic transglycosylase domain-containing protein n=1 Tax=Hansschlegelia zhihuaiae TaxID=405005 RepID=UPI0019D4A2F0|nr:lytic transglycosylase domain-containing protein [Hansschlegelia zhihuaiae]